ncbi:MAG: bifunctional phosphopantothenoylcysteine decarboxylase/phosphopantothenate--cysteine ligase CoaBC [Nitrospirales bacterium]|nr:bifunctional phosphopantothenoylcysteine decarboxylase/phosphopantothenate--cysteine ligase CoaBC [Nitrospira sp.]MDR4500183.1 bifunctional phosphopantothenoylcysteine decarboxylase/phosphopantothenate--cysteine ligase CoaBC [Nitrospirales bacterium]
MSPSRLQGIRLLLGVSGSIAAYKAVSLLRTFLSQGADVSVVMTESATRFVAPLTFEALSKHPVSTDLFANHQEMQHLTLPESADIIVLAPCTANTIAKAALGLADDLLSTLLLTTQRSIVMAPAMDGEMWDHPATQGHVQTLRSRGVVVLDPEIGDLASGKVGRGRLPDEETIISAVVQALQGSKNLFGRRLLISAGPTREPLDAVRFISNGSSGKMGYALARAARAQGAEVMLVSGPTSQEAPKGIELVPVNTAEEMYRALLARFTSCDILIMAAAVGDFRPKYASEAKFKKHTWQGEPLELEPTTDILSALSAQRTHQILVGFAAETDNLLENGAEKLRKKHLDMVVVNQVGGPESAFNNETNEVCLLTRQGTHMPLSRMSKRLVAERILYELQPLLATSSTPSRPIASIPHS